MAKGHQFDRLPSFLEQIDHSFRGERVRAVGFLGSFPRMVQKYVKIIRPRSTRVAAMLDRVSRAADALPKDMQSSWGKTRLKEGKARLEDRTDFYDFIDKELAEEYPEKDLRSWAKRHYIDLPYLANFAFENAQHMLNHGEGFGASLALVRTDEIEAAEISQLQSGVLGLASEDLLLQTIVYLDHIGFDFLVDFRSKNGKELAQHLGEIEGAVTSNNVEGLKKALKDYVQGLLMPKLRDYYKKKGESNLVFSEPAKIVMKVGQFLESPVTRSLTTAAVTALTGYFSMQHLTPLQTGGLSLGAGVATSFLVKLFGIAEPFLYSSDFQQFGAALQNVDVAEMKAWALDP